MVLVMLYLIYTQVSTVVSATAGKKGYPMLFLIAFGEGGFSYSTVP